MANGLHLRLDETWGSGHSPSLQCARGLPSAAGIPDLSQSSGDSDLNSYELEVATKATGSFVSVFAVVFRTLMLTDCEHPDRIWPWASILRTSANISNGRMKVG